MAVIVFRCTDCDREIQIIEQPQGLETIGRCVITNRCRGNLYKVDRKQDFAVGQFPPDVTGLTNWIQRNVVFDHTQAIAEDVWTVIHNLGVNPSVQVLVDRETLVDGVIITSRIEIEPQSITLVDENILTIQFNRPESGLAQIIARSTVATQSVEAVTPAITYLPITTEGILTIGANLNSSQFPVGPSANTCIVRVYILDQETLDETAFQSAVFKDYTATLPVSTSAWSDVDEVFVNSVTYTVLTIDIGDPENDFNAPSAGTVLFQSGTSTAEFPNDQASNMIVLLSADPHKNADKNRNELFRPDLEVGPALTLDSFIFANGEFSLDQTKAEKVFPPIFSIDAAQSHP